jgi:tyrosinase
LHLDNKIDADSLKVEIKANEPLPEGGEITIDRIGVYRVSQ